jgi:hypothetical protein
VGIPEGTSKETIFLTTLKEMGFHYVDFNQRCVEPFRTLRREFGLKPPDALNLSCAAALESDIYLTGDTQLLKKRLYVPGIQFISNFENAPL